MKQAALLSLLIVSTGLSLGSSHISFAKEASQEEQVTAINFTRAETDRYMGKRIEQAGLGSLHHARNAIGVDQQRVIRMNRDTLYSSGVFDLSAPLTITMPDSGDRYMSLQLINQNHHVPFMSYQAGDITLTEELAGTRYAYIVIRTLVDAEDPLDVAKANELQDQIKTQQSDKGSAEFPNWNLQSLNEVRGTLLKLTKGLKTSKGVYGDAHDIEPIKHLIGTASGWGGLPFNDAIYINRTPTANDGITPHTLSIANVPVDGFWSISVYGEDGYFKKNEQNSYVVNDRNATKNPDGSVTIHFGGDSESQNHLPITPGWNYTVRMYRPKEALLNWEWELELEQASQ